MAQHRPSSMDIDHLAFDTALLGCAVGRVRSDTLTPDELQQTVEAAKAKGYRLLFWNLETSHPASEDIARVVMLKGGYFLCEKLTYRTELSQSIARVLRRHLHVRSSEFRVHTSQKTSKPTRLVPNESPGNAGARHHELGLHRRGADTRYDKPGHRRRRMP